MCRLPPVLRQGWDMLCDDDQVGPRAPFVEKHIRVWKIQTSVNGLSLKTLPDVQRETCVSQDQSQSTESLPDGDGGRGRSWTESLGATCQGAPRGAGESGWRGPGETEP